MKRLCLITTSDIDNVRVRALRSTIKRLCLITRGILAIGDRLSYREKYKSRPKHAPAVQLSWLVVDQSWVFNIAQQYRYDQFRGGQLGKMPFCFQDIHGCPPSQIAAQILRHFDWHSHVFLTLYNMARYCHLHKYINHSALTTSDFKFHGNITIVIHNRS